MGFSRFDESGPTVAKPGCFCRGSPAVLGPCWLIWIVHMNAHIHTNNKSMHINHHINFNSPNSACTKGFLLCPYRIRYAWRGLSLGSPWDLMGFSRFVDYGPTVPPTSCSGWGSPAAVGLCWIIWIVHMNAHIHTNNKSKHINHHINFNSPNSSCTKTFMLCPCRLNLAAQCLTCGPA